MKQYQPHEQRVIDEKADLDARAAKLVDQRLLALQHDAMGVYSYILGERIARFEPTEVQPRSAAGLRVRTPSTRYGR